jgi:hypothetical protein
MSNLTEYKRLLIDSLQARADGDGYGEDQILDILDRLWLRMSLEERTAANEFTSAVAKSHLDDAGKVIAPLTGIL